MSWVGSDSANWGTPGDEPASTRGQPDVVLRPARHPDQTPPDNEYIDVRVSKLKLVGALQKAGVTVDVTDVITDGHIEDSMTGAPQLVVDILDRDYKLLQSGVFGSPLDVELDRVPFRLVEPALTDVHQLELTFEHKLVALLRTHTSPLKANRATTTRAQFIERMLKEIAPQMPGLMFVCPEINVAQPVGAAKQSGRQLKAKTVVGNSSQAVRQPAANLSSLTVRSWDGGTLSLGPTEIHNMQLVLGVCAQLNAPAKAVLAAVETCIVETGCQNPPCQNDGTGHYSIGIFQRGGGPPSSCPANGQDIVTSAAMFLQQGFWQGIGAIALVRTQPGWSPGQIAQWCQGSAFPSRYDAAQAGADTIINALGAGIVPTGSLASSASISTQGIQGAYEFSRGQPGQPEDSWTCAQRLASEVNWRLFVAGRSSLYFVTDDDLLKSATRYRISPVTPGVTRVTFQAEIGGRTIVRKGKRQPKPSEAQLEARVSRWLAPPGTVIELEDYGPGDDRWIVSDIQRPLFDAAGQITLEAPQKPTAEPAAPTTASTSTVGGAVAPLQGTQAGAPSFQSANPIDRVYAAATWIDHRNLPYVYGGGHTGSWTSAIQSNAYDCSSAVSVALYLAGLMGGFGAPIISGQFSGWGASGRGTQLTVWFNGGHVFIQFYGRPAKRFDTVEGGSGPSGPHLRYTAPGDPGDTWEASGFGARHWPGL